ncbi:MAG: DUF1552 domain-containing protein [Armatimonadetes bacterium]|nr:DUF1552 domain-containing protein [Armatimonadota bacterium]
MLDAMAPSIARAAAAGKSAPVRAAFLFVPNGVNQASWAPEVEGSNFILPPSLEPLKSVRNEIMVLSNLAQNQGRFNEAGDHARGTSCFLTGVRPVKTEGADIRLGVSVDQVAAQKIGQQTRLPSLELGTVSGKDAGNCDSGYSCAYSSNISWRGPSQPMAKEVNPKLVFERLFGNGDPGEAKRSLTERDMYKKSMLDYVLEDAKSLEKQLGYKDKEKLDEYLYSIRQVEKQVSSLPLYSADGKLLSMPKPEGKPQDYAEHIRMMCDLLALAFQGDATRVATFMFGLAGDNRGYRVIGVPEGHHDLSHHGGDKEKLEKIRKIDRYNVTLFAYFIERLRSIKEGEGTLLDNCMVLYGSELGDGHRHSHNNLPVLLAGKGGGAFQTGRHVKYSPDTPLCNLFLSMLDTLGAKTDTFGDSTGRLPKLA